MTKRDFFRIIIKLFGLYTFIFTVFSLIPNSISNLLRYYDGSMVAVIVGTTFIAVGLLLVLLFRTDAIINVLRLDKGFDDEKIDIGNFDNQSILKFALVLIGGFLIIDYTSNLLFEVVNYFKFKGTSYAIEGTTPDYFRLAISAINVLLGYLLITNYKALARFLDK